MSFKTFCKGCQEENSECNLFEGLCHQCWRKANSLNTCEKCIHVIYSLGEDGETNVKCKAGVKWPLDCYALSIVKNKICEFRKEKENENIRSY